MVALRRNRATFESSDTKDSRSAYVPLSALATPAPLHPHVNMGKTPLWIGFLLLCSQYPVKIKTLDWCSCFMQQTVVCSLCHVGTSGHLYTTSSPSSDFVFFFFRPLWLKLSHSDTAHSQTSKRHQWATGFTADPLLVTGTECELSWSDNNMIKSNEHSFSVVLICSSLSVFFISEDSCGCRTTSLKRFIL